MLDGILVGGGILGVERAPVPLRGADDQVGGQTEVGVAGSLPQSGDGAGGHDDQTG